MTPNTLFNVTLIIWLLLAPAAFISLFFVVAPYGRHVRSGWGPSLDSKLGWVVMEAVSPLIFALCFILGSAPFSFTSLAFLLLWETHYIHRAFIYPFSLKSSNEKMPLSIALSGLGFNLVNASMNGFWIFTLSGGYPDSWLADPRFIFGTVLFICGFITNRQADDTLARLRSGGRTGYAIPQGGLYRWISCPNYFGEILIWCGWAIATWSLAGLSFALWSIANLAPRARSHHAWYHEHFPDYPPGRKALIPGVW
jgi:protein-S-isoprenylcysteine O-methyltransferase Ste14